MEYKEYKAKVDFDDEAEILYGEVLGIKDVITFHGKTIKELKKEFKASVDDYLDFCKERGEKPEKPFSGHFVVRVKPELHKKIFILSKSENKSINNWVSEKLEKVVK